MKGAIKTIIGRLKADTPRFFKHLRNLGLGAVTIATTTIAALNGVGIEMSERETEVAKNVIIIGSVVAGMAQLTKRDKANENKDR